MTDERSRDDLIELPLSHKESWDSIDKGEDRPTGARGAPRQPPRASRGRRWLVGSLLALAAALGYWIFWPDAPRVDFGVERVEFAEQLAATTSEPVEVTLTNAGERPLRIDRIGVVGGQEADFATASEDCTGRAIEALESCVVTVRFTPREVGERLGALEAAGNQRGGSSRLPLVGPAVAPRLGGRPPSLDFGSESVGATSPGRDLELVNEGGATLSVRRVAVEGEAGEFRLVGNECSSARLDPGERCALRLVFEPALLGRRSATLAVESDSFGDTGPIRLEGVGSGPDLDIEPQGLVFAEQLVGTRSEPRTLRLTNRGDETFRIQRAWLGEGSAFAIERESCSGASLAPAESCEVSVLFRPSADGEVKTSLQIRESSGGMAPGVGISGRAVSPRLELSAESLDFGAVPVGESAAPRTLRLSNGGTASLAVAELRVVGEDAAAFAKGRDSCSGVDLPPGRRCDVEVSFAPRRGGAHQARLVARSSQPGEAPEVRLSAHGRAPEISLDRGRLDFAAVRQAESQDLRLNVTNSGDAPLDIEAVRLGGAAAPDFTLVSNACRDRRLAPAESCQLLVRFAPTANGPRDARLLIESSAPRSVSLVVRGSGLPPPTPDIAVEPRSLRFGALPVGERSGVLTIRIASTGEGPLRIREVRVEGPDAGDFRVVPGTCQGLERIVPGGDCTMGLRFIPTAAGPRRAELVVEHDAARGAMLVAVAAEGL